MSKLNKQHTQFLLMGLAAVAAAGVLFYLTKESATAKSGPKDGGKTGAAGGDASKAKDRSLDTSTVKTSNTSSSKSSEPKKTTSGTMDEKELHAKIEELDRKGKGFFKNKQVGGRLRS